MSVEHPQRPPASIVYIVSRGHSGSTLLTMAIGRHRQAAPMGEIANLSLQCYREEPKTKWTGRCDCGERPYDCPIWSPIIAAVQDEFGADMRADPFSFRVSDVGLEEEFREQAPRKAPGFWISNRFWRMLRYARYHRHPLLRGLGAIATPQRRWATNRAFIAAQFRKINAVDLAVDSSKDVLGAIDMHRYSGEQVRVLFLTRDPRGSIWSKIKHQPDHPHRAREIDKEADEWARINLRFMRLLENIPPEDQMRVPYESLCHEPDATVRAIESFLGLPHDDGILDPAPQEFHMVAGNKIRFSLRDFVIREDKAWRKGLTAEEAERVMRLAEPIASQLDYGNG